MNAKRRKMSLLVLLVLSSLACGLIDTVLNRVDGGEENMIPVAALWSDVPPMEGMSATQSFGMPEWLKVLTSPILDGMLKQFGASHWEWTGFTLSEQLPADVQAFYTQERMAAYGWKQAESACAPMTDKGVLCSFLKEEAAGTTALMIIAARDEQQKETSVFFLRASGVQGISAPESATQPAPAAGGMPTLAPVQDVDGDGQIGVCEIIPQAVLEETLGRALAAPAQPFSDPALGEGCAYDFGSDGDAAYFAYITLASEGQFNAALANATQAETVTSVGDSAFLNYGPDARQLWVRVGNKAALVAIGDRENIPAAMLFARYLIEFVKNNPSN
ncbi:MAG: hypothetical protein N3D16_11640 [Anaerolineales bacterium]|nr:hypothetical protein [Anaerolineales bacterium]